MDKKCRLCLEKSAPRNNIFDPNLDIVEPLLRYCNLKASKYDGLPECICQKCVRKFKDIQKYFNKCIETDKTLRAVLGIKSENNEVEEKFTDLNFSNVQEGCAQIYHIETKIEIKEEYLEDTKFDDCVSIKHSDSDDWPISEDDFDSYFDNAKTKGKKKEKDVDEKSKINLLKDKSKIKDRDYDPNSRLCPFCGQFFKYSYHMKKHEKLHSGEQYKCDLCEKIFIEKRYLATHILRHTMEKKLKCAYCNKRFKFEKQMKEHTNYMHKSIKPITCSICHISLSRKQALVNHMRTHSEFRPHQCVICLRSFRTLILLKSHQRVHADERPFTCQFCDSSFKMTKTLKEHERLHTGEKPYLCPVCGKAFAQNGNMKSHFRFNHKDLNYKEERAKVQAQNNSENYESTL